MIVSHEHQFIFLKTRKTAGTSVELALSRHCGPADIITETVEADEVLRQQIGGRPPQNTSIPAHRYSARDLAGVILAGRRPRPAYPHMPAAQVRQLVGRNSWSRYVKFTIERNPWDAAVSFYYWRRARGESRSLNDFIQGDGLDVLARNSQIYSLRGELAVDHVCRFEDLQGDLGQVFARIGLPTPVELPHAKAAMRTDRRHYSEVLDQRSRDEVSRRFRPVIELMGYRYA